MTQYMRLDTAVGSKIRFHGQGGYKAEQARARVFLAPGDLREVLEVNVGNFSSRVKIAEGWFNTCLFENAD